MMRSSVLLPLALVLAACPRPEPGSPDAAAASDAAGAADADGPGNTRSYRMGIATFIPANYPDSTPQDYADYQVSLPSYGELFNVQVGWDQDHGDDDIPDVVELAYAWTAGTEVTVYVGIGAEVGALTPGERAVYWQTIGDDFRRTALAIAAAYQPRYLALGIECNRWFAVDEAAFGEFVTVYRDTYDAIKAAHPEVLVGNGFQLDYMRGGGALTGMVNDPHWQVLDMFAGKIDFIGISAYPWLDFADPAEIPDDYFTEISGHLAAPIIISETGWPSEGPFVMESSQEAQVRYLQRMLEVTEGVDLRGFIYGLPFDADLTEVFGTPVFNYLGLAENDGTPKLLWQEWQALRELEVFPTGFPARGRLGRE